MEGDESIVAQVERFEDYCLRKRSLEGDIELVLARRDDTVVEAVELAEYELGKYDAGLCRGQGACREGASTGI